MNVRKFLLEALLGFVLWTLYLTPYALFVMKVSVVQYGWWLLGEAVLVPPFAIVVVNITNKVTWKVNMESVSVGSKEKTKP